MTAVVLAAGASACDSTPPVTGGDELPAGPVGVENLWFGGDREAENQIRAEGVVPIWFRVPGPAPDPDLTVTVAVSSGETTAHVTLEPMRLLTDAELCEILRGGGGAILVFQEEDGSDPSPATAEEVRDELLSLGLELRLDFGDGISARIPADGDVVSAIRSHPNVRAVRPLPFPGWPAILIEPALVESPASWYQYERWGMVWTESRGMDSACGAIDLEEIPVQPGATLDVRYRQPDDEIFSSSASVVESIPEADVDACLADVAAMEIEDLGPLDGDDPDPESRPPWYGHDASLAAWFSEANGHGSVGFKEAESPPSSETGDWEAVSAGTIRKGLEAVCRSGAYELRYDIGNRRATAKLPAEAAPSLRSEAIVDYVTPANRVGAGPGDVRLVGMRGSPFD